MKRHLTLTALLAALALPLAATGQTCEELKAGWAKLRMEAESLIAEIEAQQKERENSMKKWEAGEIDNAQAERDLKKSRAQTKERDGRQKAIFALFEAVLFTAEAKGCQADEIKG